MQTNPYDTMVNKILPQLVKRFREKSSDYGDVFKELGIAGQYSDMHRKMYKLKRVMWYSGSLQGEQADEILADLFGNILISLYLLNESEENQRAASSEPSSGQDTDSQGTSTNRQKGRARKQATNAVRQSASP